MKLRRWWKRRSLDRTRKDTHPTGQTSSVRLLDKMFTPFGNGRRPYDWAEDDE